MRQEQTKVEERFAQSHKVIAKQATLRRKYIYTTTTTYRLAQKSDSVHRYCMLFA